MAIDALNSPVEGHSRVLDVEFEREVQRRAGAIAWTARYHPCRPQCLHRSLVLYRWLRNRGILAQLEIGWGDKIGHAWISYGGKVLNDHPDIASITPPFLRKARSLSQIRK
jgi:hypothetical protein